MVYPDIDGVEPVWSAVDVGGGDAEALARLLAWMRRGEGRIVTVGFYPHSGETWVQAEDLIRGWKRLYVGYGMGFAEAVEDVLARAEG